MGENAIQMAIFKIKCVICSFNVSGKIGIFYLIFYSCLAAFFAAFLAGLLSLMDDKFPNQTGMNSLIKGNPGKRKINSCEPVKVAVVILDERSRVKKSAQYSYQ